MLCIRGFLAARKHADRILLLVEMLGTSGFPCFKAGIKTVYALRRRFALQATEPQVLHTVSLLGAAAVAASWHPVQPDNETQDPMHSDTTAFLPLDSAAARAKSTNSPVLTLCSVWRWCCR